MGVAQGVFAFKVQLDDGVRDLTYPHFASMDSASITKTWATGSG